MSTSDYIRGALDDVDTTARRIPMYQVEGQSTLAAYASHVVQGRFAEVALLAHLHRVDPELADKVAAWIGEVQADRDKLGRVLSYWAEQVELGAELNVFGPEGS